MNKVFNTSNSDTMHEKIKQDPQYLVQYHEKLDETRKLWTIDPVKVIANKINNLPIPDRIIAKMVIGDFGCGRTKLAKLLNNKVYNFDHHSILGENIIACDMKRTTLKNETLDVAVFSLSLMGQNWTEYIAEAKRCLRKRGMLMIAETTKSLNARLSGLKYETFRKTRRRFYFHRGNEVIEGVSFLNTHMYSNLALYRIRREIISLIHYP
jgi:putative methyltransferase